MISGVSGIGKTALVRELVNQPEVVDTIFLSGKFDQTGIPKPYSGLAQALEGLITDLLTADVEKINHWRQ